MRIVALHVNAESLEPFDIEVLLRRLASLPDPLAAAKWQMILDLVKVLRADGPVPEASGHLLGDELHLSPSNPANAVTVSVRADWHDFGAVKDGLPEMHYRLQIKRDRAKLSRDARAPSTEEAARIIREAFGWAT